MIRISVLLITLALSLVACSPSGEERKRIASKACSEIMETRKFESSKRASIWNDAVDKIGLKGSYWNNYSDTVLNLNLLSDGSLRTTMDCEASLLKGNGPFITDDD